MFLEAISILSVCFNSSKPNGERKTIIAKLVYDTYVVSIKGIGLNAVHPMTGCYGVKVNDAVYKELNLSSLRKKCVELAFEREAVQ